MLKEITELAERSIYIESTEIEGEKIAVLEIVDSMSCLNKNEKRDIYERIISAEIPKDKRHPLKYYM